MPASVLSPWSRWRKNSSNHSTNSGSSDANSGSSNNPRSPSRHVEPVDINDGGKDSDPHWDEIRDSIAKSRGHYRKHRLSSEHHHYHAHEPRVITAVVDPNQKMPAVPTGVAAASAAAGAVVSQDDDDNDIDDVAVGDGGTKTKRKKKKSSNSPHSKYAASSDDRSITSDSSGEWGRIFRELPVDGPSPFAARHWQKKLKGSSSRSPKKNKRRLSKKNAVKMNAVAYTNVNDGGSGSGSDNNDDGQCWGDLGSIVEVQEIVSMSEFSPSPRAASATSTSRDLSCRRNLYDELSSNIDPTTMAAMKMMEEEHHMNSNSFNNLVHDDPDVQLNNHTWEQLFAADFQPNSADAATLDGTGLSGLSELLGPDILQTATTASSPSAVVDDDDDDDIPTMTDSEVSDDKVEVPASPVPGIIPTLPTPPRPAPVQERVVSTGDESSGHDDDFQECFSSEEDIITSSTGEEGEGAKPPPPPSIPPPPTLPPRVRSIRFADEQGLPISNVFQIVEEFNPLDVDQVVVLLLSPANKKFEFVHAVYRSYAETSVSDLLRQLPEMASSELFAKAEYVALHRTKGQREEIDRFSLLEEIPFEKGEAAVAVIKGHHGEEFVQCGLTLLRNSRVMKAVQRARRSGRGMKYVKGKRTLERELEKLEKKQNNDDDDDEKKLSSTTTKTALQKEGLPTKSSTGTTAADTSLTAPSSMLNKSEDSNNNTNNNTINNNNNSPTDTADVPILMDELPEDVDGGIAMDATAENDENDPSSSSPDKTATSSSSNGEWNAGLVQVLHAGVIATIGVLFSMSTQQ